MSKRSRGSGPTADDLALWETVSKSITPLKRRPPPEKDDKREGQEAASARPPAKPVATRPTRAPLSPPPRPPRPPELAPLEKRLRTRLVRGAMEIDARIDLHGMTQAAAHRRLRSFLATAQTAGAKLVLVITGKGRPGDEQPLGEERGVLKRSVPIWLASEEMRRFVIGYDTAGRSHGGEGALYVRIRSRRKAES